MKPSKAAATLFVALCFLSLVISCESKGKNATKPKPANGNTTASQSAGSQTSQQSGNQNSGSSADTNSASQPAANLENPKNNENPEPGPSDEDRSRKESSTLGSFVDVWSKIVFPFGATLLLAGTLYSLFVLKRRMSEVETYLYKDLKPNISDIRNARKVDKTSQGKSDQDDSAGQGDLLRLNTDLSEIKRIAQSVEMELSGLKEEIRKGNALEQEADGGKLLDEAPETDSNSKVPPKEPFVLADLGQRVIPAGTVPFPIPISVADCLRYLESENVHPVEVKGEGLREGGVFVPASGGKFLLIPGPDKAQRDFFVIPKVLRFATIQDYTHYQKYYDCNNPCSGDVWIISPVLAVPDSERKEWRLVEKGQLEIRT